jgi:uncharacterized membrane protein
VIPTGNPPPDLASSNTDEFGRRTMQAVLRLIHIGDAFLWAGGALFLALFVTPAAKAAGDGAGPFMGALVMKTRLMTVMTIASILTVGSGLWLWVEAFGAMPPPGFKGVAISVGAVGGVLALGVALGMQRPTIVRLQGILGEVAGNGGPPNEDQMARLQAVRARMMKNGNLLAVCVGVAIVGMALGG